VKVKSPKEVWEVVLGELQIQVSKPNYQTWLEKTAGVSYENKQFIISAPSPFVAEYLDKNLRSLIEKTLIGLTHQDLEVLFRVTAKHPFSPSRLSSKSHPTKLNPQYTFDSFVVGNSNRLAYAACLGVAESPGHSYNPLFIYGGVGLGKTHLLHAMGHLAQASNTQALYVSAEHYTNEFILAIRSGKTEDFRNKYRNVDMLLIDDIHFIGGKEQTEESFLHTFNELHNNNRQIAITSNCLPNAMPLLHPPLRSRLEWGLVTQIQPPGFDTRLAILQAKAEQAEVRLEGDVLQLIASRSQQNIRQLEGYLNRVIAYTKLVKVPLTLEVATKALEDIASKAPQGVSITPNLVIQGVANSFHISPTELTGRKGDKQTSLARQVAMYLIKQETNCALTQIGKELGNRNHSTVIHACKKIAREIETNPGLRDKILDIQQNFHTINKL